MITLISFHSSNSLVYIEREAGLSTIQLIQQSQLEDLQMVFHALSRTKPQIDQSHPDGL